MDLLEERQRNAVWGAAVADAASLGFHWLYSQERIRELAPETPEFRTPNGADYEGVPAYFAHAARHSGQCSQYGEQMLTLLRSLAANDGVYDAAHYRSSFCNHFGYGGAYVGYIDHPTRDTLNNIARAEQAALAVADTISFSGSDELKRKLITKVLAQMKLASGDVLLQRVEDSVRLTHNDDYLVTHALQLTLTLSNQGGHSGADDTQLPALSKLPPLVALCWDDNRLSNNVESAVRVTNNNNKSVAFSIAASELMRVAIETGDLQQVLHTARNIQDPIVAPLVAEAFAYDDEPSPEATARWGLACQLAQGFPSLMHNLARQHNFVKSIRQNIYAGGDSCERSIVLGAVLGACFGRDDTDGIPEEWIKNLSDKDDIERCLDVVLGGS